MTKEKILFAILSLRIYDHNWLYKQQDELCCYFKLKIKQVFIAHSLTNKGEIYGGDCI